MYCASGTVITAFMHYFISSTKQLCNVGTFIIPILQMEKLRFHEVNWLAQSQTALSYRARAETQTDSNAHCSMLPPLQFIYAPA